ncbi:MAG TPA: hypothetical protein VG325_00805 [Solirubrobacteraceae bacterium]|nr:hypothetical protein [Solirubrobacteraceae bacterium]
MRVLRPALLLVAVAACAWFALGVRQSHEVDGATSVVSAANPTAAQLRAAAAQLRSASFLNPDRTVDILRARVAIKQHRLPQARRILAAATRGEPENLEAWIWFTGTNLGRPAGMLGRARIIALDPLDARAVGG